ncbi:MAG: hypothetical protein OIN66_05760 [Candidatus Methanoperedens sp.]|nr:hypothetical protein [Candidatus Methanoperedens sp.]
MKGTTVLLAIWMLLTFLIVLPAGAVPAGQTPTNNSNTTYNPSAGSAPARGGNITNIDFINTLTQTSKWQAYYGNVTGKIILGNSSSGSMFNWTVSTLSGAVYATQQSVMNFTAWDNLAARTGANIDSDFSFTAGNSDSATNTFTGDPAALIVNGKSINGGSNTGTRTYNLARSPTWWTVALADSTAPSEGNYVFAGILSPAGEAFDGTQKDFQMIVPENEASGTETYYFYVELI